ncbi:hypothetical protein P43SY_005939 [Pythium insidiosum]|uniref:Kinesin-like protein n=1 Tax=Pythium insidiosum TaxID=114742 RepID=A0AAD5M5B8_PYTIN|nr:hypothetical protein P43SY_005939 [Pythium insidiosum]
MPSDLVPNAAPRVERVKVFCRVRPLLQRERDGWSYEDFAAQVGDDGSDGQRPTPGDTEPSDPTSATFLTEKGKIPLTSTAVTANPDGKTIVYSGSDSTREFTFDAALSEEVSQDDVYHHVAFDIVQDALEGFNGTILAYGQTSTGKTHTMLGQDDALDGDQRGIVPRAFEDIFDRAERARTTTKTTVVLSYVQIYCERVFDLLAPETSPSSILIREDAERGVYLDGAATVAVSSVADCMRVVARGNANRAVASTHMNAHSSRSHAVLIARIERKDYATTKANSNNVSDAAKPTQLLKLSHLYLVDLAGSERVKKARVVGRHVNELKAINLSLSALGNCIAALSRQQPQRHVPYRDSKLTRLLQSSLGGNAKTALVVTVSPSSTEAPETLSTLQFGQRAMKVAVQAHRNVLSVLDYKALYEETQQALDEQQQQLQRLETELATQCQARQAVDDQLVKAQLRIQHLEFECQASKLAATASTGDKSARGDRGLEPQLGALVAQHERDVAAVKERCDVHVATYKRLADEAQQEWHDLEDELAKEKQQVLVTLQELKEFKLRFFELEQESTERIAELVQEAKDREREARDERAELQRKLQAQEQDAASLRDKVAEMERRNHELQDQLDLEYVPKDTIKQMEALYESAISKLQSRVGSLEQRSGSSRNLSNNNNNNSSNGGSADDRESCSSDATRAGKSGALPALVTSAANAPRKAIPKIGRVVPAARSNSLR